MLSGCWLVAAQLIFLVITPLQLSDSSIAITPWGCAGTLMPAELLSCEIIASASCDGGRTMLGPRTVSIASSPQDCCIMPNAVNPATPGGLQNTDKHKPPFLSFHSTTYSQLVPKSTCLQPNPDANPKRKLSN